MSYDTLVGKSLGNYEIIQKLGTGRSSVVYQARQPGTRRIVAIKVFPEAFTDKPEFQANFEREARIVAQLEHYHILPIYEVGSANDIPFVVMRYISGGTLADRIAKDAPMKPADTVPIVQQLASALEFAHQRGIIHRDLKPANILLDDDNNAYISDFGLKHVRAAILSATKSKVPGTPGYLAPEELDSKATPGPSIDIYSLGVITFEMLTGKLPYVHENPIKQAMMHVREPIPKVSAFNEDLSAEIDVVIEKAMAKDTEARFPSAFSFSRSYAQTVGVTTDAVQRTDINKIIADTSSTGAISAIAPSAADSEAAGSTAEEAEEISAIIQTGVKKDEGAKASALVNPVEERRGGALGYIFLLAILALVFFVGGVYLGLLARQQPELLAGVPGQTDGGETTVTEEAEEEPVAVVEETEETPEPEEEEAPAEEAEEVDEEEPEPTPTPEPEVFPVFGNGGGSIAFSSDRDGNPEIFILDLETREITQITEQEDPVTSRRPEWSPSGDILAFDSSAAGNGRHIYLYRDEVTQLTTAVREDAYPQWFEDGSVLMYRSFENPRVFIRTTSVDGDDEELLAQLPQGDTLLYDLSPAGVLSYLGFDATGTVALQQLPPGGDAPDRYNITENDPTIAHVDFSPDRSQAVYTAVVNNVREVFLADTSCEVYNIPDCVIRRVTNDGMSYWQPEFSPDGELLLVSVSELNNIEAPRDLWIMNLEGELIEQITDTAFDERDGTWQPASE